MRLWWFESIRGSLWLEIHERLTGLVGMFSLRARQDSARLKGLRYTLRVPRRNLGLSGVWRSLPYSVKSNTRHRSGGI